MVPDAVAPDLDADHVKTGDQTPAGSGPCISACPTEYAGNLC